MKKLTILALHLGYGGIEKCISEVSNLLSNDFNIEILSIYKLYGKEVYKFNNNIKITYLTNIKPNRYEFISYLKQFRLIKAFKEGLKSIKILHIKKKVIVNALKNANSDIVISTNIFLNKLLGKYSNCKLKIAWEHNHYQKTVNYANKFMNSCKNINKAILVSKDIYNYYSNLFDNNNIKCKCVYIPNFIDNKFAIKSSLLNKNIISVGRLSKEKGFSDLIDVFKLINEKDDSIKLTLVGDGSEYNNIKNKIKEYKLENNINMTGYLNSDQIDKLYEESSIYLMTSYTESFGLVLIEAMSHGVVPVAFNSAQGSKEIIENNYNGYLISNRDKEEMASITVDLLNNKNKLKELSNNTYLKVMEYSSDKVYNKWVELLKGDNI
ncbi:MAG: glycosyltransferase [Bacilli bacterium]|nr:glycosyltransferase [Bacilli bacterium]